MDYSICFVFIILNKNKTDMKYYRPSKNYPTTNSSDNSHYHKDCKDLNLSKSKNSDVDVKIDKWLGYSYHFFAPFFEDEVFINTSNKALKNEKREKDFEYPLPPWLASVFYFMSNLYRNLFQQKEFIPRLKKFVKMNCTKSKNIKPSNSFKKTSLPL
jgi:hypothetical protein